MKMSGTVTVQAKRDEIFFGIIPELAARSDVVNLKIARCAAILAAPPIAREHFAGELAIRVGFKAQSRPFRFESDQDCSSRSRATAAAALREEWRSAERAPRTTYLPAPGSRLAPARKSAAIISKL